jgi:hypothetical protein
MVMKTLPPDAVGIPSGTVSFRATLTATSNPYLADRLPCDGLVRIGERDVHGRCTRVTFMPLDAVARRSSFVAVPDAEFHFNSRV